MMRKIGSVVLLALILTMSLSPAVMGQSNSRFDGDWIGKINAGEHEVSIRLVIRGNQARQYFRGEDGWEVVSPDKMDFMIDRNNAVMVWLNSGGVWSETQTYSLSLKSDNQLEVVWTRHVNNLRPSQNNDTWNLTGAGTLTKVA